MNSAIAFRLSINGQPVLAVSFQTWWDVVVAVLVLLLLNLVYHFAHGFVQGWREAKARKRVREE